MTTARYVTGQAGPLLTTAGYRSCFILSGRRRLGRTSVLHRGQQAQRDIPALAVLVHHGSGLALVFHAAQVVANRWRSRLNRAYQLVPATLSYRRSVDWVLFVWEFMTYLGLDRGDRQ